MTVGTLGLWDCLPSRGIYYQQLETIAMSTLTAGQLGTVSFYIPQNVTDAMNGEYTDLQITIVVNSVPMSSPVLLDNMRIVAVEDADTDSAYSSLPDIIVDSIERDFVFTLPIGVTLADAFLTSNESMRLSNAVTVANESAVISNMGTGRFDMNTDVSLAGDVYAMGDVTLADRVQIGGFLRADGTVTMANDVVIDDGDQDVAIKSIQ